MKIHPSKVPKATSNASFNIDRLSRGFDGYTSAKTGVDAGGDSTETM